MFNAVGGGNTPRVNERYYRVPSCGALAHKIFGLPTKAENTLIQTKIERYTESSTSAHQTAEDGGDTLCFNAQRNRKQVPQR
jgi:hypothetical protein